MVAKKKPEEPMPKNVVLHGKDHKVPMTPDHQVDVAAIPRGMKRRIQTKNGQVWKVHRHRHNGTLYFTGPKGERSTMDRAHLFKDKTKERQVVSKEELEEGIVAKVKRFFRKATGSQRRRIIKKSNKKSKLYHGASNYAEGDFAKQILKPEHHHLVDAHFKKHGSHPMKVFSAAVGFNSGDDYHKVRKKVAAAYGVNHKSGTHSDMKAGFSALASARVTTNTNRQSVKHSLRAGDARYGHASNLMGGPAGNTTKYRKQLRKKYKIDEAIVRVKKERGKHCVYKGKECISRHDDRSSAWQAAEKIKPKKNAFQRVADAIGKRIVESNANKYQGVHGYSSDDKEYIHKDTRGKKKDRNKVQKQLKSTGDRSYKETGGWKHNQISWSHDGSNEAKNFIQRQHHVRTSEEHPERLNAKGKGKGAMDRTYKQNLAIGSHGARYKERTSNIRGDREKYQHSIVHDTKTGHHFYIRNTTIGAKHVSYLGKHGTPELKKKLKLHESEQVDEVFGLRKPQKMTQVDAGNKAKTKHKTLRGRLGLPITKKEKADADAETTKDYHQRARNLMRSHTRRGNQISREITRFHADNNPNDDRLSDEQKADLKADKQFTRTMSRKNREERRYRNQQIRKANNKLREDIMEDNELQEQQETAVDKYAKFISAQLQNSTSSPFGTHNAPVDAGTKLNESKKHGTYQFGFDYENDPDKSERESNKLLKHAKKHGLKAKYGTGHGEMFAGAGVTVTGHPDKIHKMLKSSKTDWHDVSRSEMEERRNED